MLFECRHLLISSDFLFTKLMSLKFLLIQKFYHVSVIYDIRCSALSPKSIILFDSTVTILGFNILQLCEEIIEPMFFIQL